MQAFMNQQLLKRTRVHLRRFFDIIVLSTSSRHERIRPADCEEATCSLSSSISTPISHLNPDILIPFPDSQIPLTPNNMSLVLTMLGPLPQNS